MKKTSNHKKFKDLHKVTQIVMAELRNESRMLAPETMILTSMYCCLNFRATLSTPLPVSEDNFAIVLPMVSALGMFTIESVRPRNDNRTFLV